MHPELRYIVQQRCMEGDTLLRERPGADGNLIPEYTYTQGAVGRDLGPGCLPFPSAPGTWYDSGGTGVAPVEDLGDSSSEDGRTKETPLGRPLTTDTAREVG